jgi:hypothetical protein
LVNIQHSVLSSARNLSTLFWLFRRLSDEGIFHRRGHHCSPVHHRSAIRAGQVHRCNWANGEPNTALVRGVAQKGARLCEPASSTSLRKGSRDLAAVAQFHIPGLDAVAGLGEAMKLSRARERMPLTVWITLVVLTLASVAYIAGVFLFDDFLALFSEKR